MNLFPNIGVVGCGTMGRGIALLAAQNGHRVVAYDTNELNLSNAQTINLKSLEKLLSKSKITNQELQDISSSISYSTDIEVLGGCDLIVEAVIEDLSIKKSLFARLEAIAPQALLATNTSSLSITSVAAACQNSGQVIGIHFFNPAPVMQLIEVIPAIQTSLGTLESAQKLLLSWNKTVVVAKDTPGFIVNRVARPFYGEALRIYEEGIADFATIDWAMRHLGGFKMGPFELMDYIGLDVNYAVSETVFREFYFDPRYRPSFIQKRLVEAGFLGRKTGRGFYDYGKDMPQPVEDEKLGREVLDRILAMLINEATEAAYLQIATPKDIDLAMTKGTSYPKGLLTWGEEIGLDTILNKLESLQQSYGDDRYRPSYLLKKLVKQGRQFF